MPSGNAQTGPKPASPCSTRSAAAMGRPIRTPAWPPPLVSVWTMSANVKTNPPTAAKITRTAPAEPTARRERVPAMPSGNARCGQPAALASSIRSAVAMDRPTRTPARPAPPASVLTMSARAKARPPWAAKTTRTAAAAAIARRTRVIEMVSVIARTAQRGVPGYSFRSADAMDRPIRMPAWPPRREPPSTMLANAKTSLKKAVEPTRTAMRSAIAQKMTAPVTVLESAVYAPRSAPLFLTRSAAAMGRPIQTPAWQQPRESTWPQGGTAGKTLPGPLLIPGNKSCAGRCGPFFLPGRGRHSSCRTLRKLFFNKSFRKAPWAAGQDFCLDASVTDSYTSAPNFRVAIQ